VTRTVDGGPAGQGQGGAGGLLPTQWLDNLLGAPAPTPPPSLTPRIRPPKPAYVPGAPNSVAVSRTLQMISIVIFGLLFNLVLVSQVQHFAWQNSLYSELRLHLAEGAAPTGPADADGLPTELGTPLALMQAPTIGIGKEVVVEGTASAQTMEGIGHLRSTVLPCQVGTSVLMARGAAYGGVGGSWAGLQPGQQFTMTMGQGACTYEVIGSRRAGDPSPPLPIGREGRLILTTSDGAYLPFGVLRIDAKLVTDGFDRPPIALPDASLPDSERAMGIDSSGAFGLVLLLEALAGAAIGVTWLWKRWGRWEAWIVGIPVIAAIGLLTATNANYFLPNLL
jgi:sortase A